jgi:hypothetical protein
MSEYIILSKQQQQQPAKKTISTQTTTTPNKFHVIAKKKLEKIKNKFAEFFLSSPTTTTASSTPSVSTYNSINNISQSSEVNKLIINDLSYIPHTTFIFTNIRKLKKFHNQYQLNADGKSSILNQKYFLIKFLYFRRRFSIKFIR